MKTFSGNRRISKGEVMVEAITKVMMLDPVVQKAMGEIERELFVPRGFSMAAYKLDALPISGNQWISSPLTVARMTQALMPAGFDSVLEIGCGSGYQAAVLSKMARRVCTVERIERLLVEAKGRFKQLGVMNILSRLADGQEGWPEYAPFDRILFSASVKEVPRVLFDQLEEGGILVAPIEEGERQVITRFVKQSGRIRTEAIEACQFVPVLDGIESLD